jgi:hypothetical protein
MIFQCADLERALRTAELMPDARRHAEHCEHCREQLYLWNEISRAAPQLHEEWESDTLWPRIREALSAEPVRHQRPRTWRWALAIAAMVTLAGGLLTLPHAASPGGPELLSDSALREVQQAETAYARSIDKLASVAQPGMEQSGSPLAAAYREKLVLLDSAIADLKNNVDQNRYNAYLRTELASLYGEKQKTLREWMDYAKSK